MAKKPTIELRKITDLTPSPRNARKHSDGQVAALANLIRRFGWTSPILTDDVIQAGHGRRLAALSIYEAGERIFMAPGADNGGAELPDGTVPVIDCSGWTEDERRAFALADNKIALMADWDDAILREEIEALSKTEISLDLTGFVAADIEQMFGASGTGRPAGGGDLQDSNFNHVDQYGLNIMCKDAADQQALFERLTAEGLDVKVVVV